MTSQPPPTNADIAQRAQELKVMHLGLILTIPMMLHPQLPVLQWARRLVDAGPDEDIPLQLQHGSDDDEEMLTYSSRVVLTLASQLRGKIMGEDLMSASMLVGGTRIGDLIRQRCPWPRDQPLIQFARHFRNACAHGDRWDLVKDEPRYPAACRNLVVTRDLNGKRATYETVSPRLYVEFLDDVSNHFVPGLVPPPGRQT